MKRILIATLAVLACSAAFAQPASTSSQYGHHRSKHHKPQHTARHARHTADSVADRSQPLDSADFKP
ncbi:Spy/CpxP family protein refolding chaperone [Paraburkholderia bannensis]|uniref:Spy/CpxP family protein refolding chaperone n=1 Tax=Paraburkholderia bannensis TaxID=765414 RepID=A0A7W9U3J2_9BURK|nr:MULTISPECIES: hypothetical protein [Paraburkholderia]MBB3261419.1 Spy/CpxP family protein refolding chaperone [Paraburkholderia sp. WP4_3_2]MBB6106381.1 Spy/CpxP family protein refolding chaperone [Paraburkholderia bannensis]